MVGCCSAAKSVPAPDRAALVISLPGIPNPPTFDRNAGQLYRGKARWLGQSGQPEPIDPVQALTQAALQCGQSRFEWRNLNYDHINEMVLQDTAAARRALRCFAARLPFDFYVRREAPTANVR